MDGPDDKNNRKDIRINGSKEKWKKALNKYVNINHLGFHLETQSGEQAKASDEAFLKSKMYYTSQSRGVKNLTLPKMNESKLSLHQFPLDAILYSQRAEKAVTTNAEKENLQTVGGVNPFVYGNKTFYASSQFNLLEAKADIHVHYGENPK